MALPTIENPTGELCRFGDAAATHITPASWGSEKLCAFHAEHHPSWESGSAHPTVPKEYRKPNWP